MLNPNPGGGMDPSGRNFGGQYGPNQGQAGNNVYNLGGNIQALHSMQQSGLQAGLAGRPGYGMPASSGHLQQGERFQNLGPNHLHQLNPYGQGPNRAGMGHPGVGLGAGFSNNPGRNQFGQIGLPNHGNIGNRPSVLPSANMNLPVYNGNMGAGTPQPPGLGLGLGGALGGRGVAMRNLNSLGSGIDRGIQNMRVPGGVGLLQHAGGVSQQSNAPIPSQDLLAMMTRSNPRVQSGMFNMGQMQGGGVGVGQGGNTIGGPHGNSLFAQQQRAAGLMPGGMDGGGGQHRQGPMGSGGDMGRPAFDANDFPSLVNTVQRPGMGMSQGLMTNSAGMEMSSLNTHPEGLATSMDIGNRGFTMQNEDFPALPTNQQNPSAEMQSVHGPQRILPPSPNQAAIGRGVLRVPPPPSSSLPEQSRPSSSVGQPYFQSSHNMPSSVHDQLKTIQQVNFQQRLGGRSFVSEAKSPAMLSAPADSQGSCDRFSLLGLLSVIRMIDEDLAMLALGQDLTTLGLKLDQAGSDLHKTFLSPWSNNQLPGPHPEFRVPKCYLLPAEKLRPEYLQKFKDETLFYIFYSCPGEEGQLLAGRELAHRGLVWHKDLKVWMMRLPNQSNIQKSQDGWERGSYVFFDTNEWKYQRRDNFVLKYEAIESNPTLPRAGGPGSNQVRQQPPPPQPPPAVGGPGSNQIMVPAS